MQYSEKEQLESWKNDHPGRRFMDVDVPLSFGITDIVVHPDVLNAVTVHWSEKCSLFIKVHCISTEFTQRKHGGEKGVPFRIQVETYTENGEKILHCAACQIKVFKPKGADRKHKTDREKIEKKPESERAKYRPVSNVTKLVDVPLEVVQHYLIMNPKTVNFELENPPDTPSNTPIASPSGTVKCLTTTNVTTTASTTIKTISSNVSANSTSAEVVDWLNNNRFSSYSRVFENFSGSDLLRLTRDELIQICGLADGIRLDNALQVKNVRPRLTLFVCQETRSSRRASEKGEEHTITRVRSEGSLSSADEDTLLTSLKFNTTKDIKPIRKLVKGKRCNFSGNAFRDNPPIKVPNPTSKRHKENDGNVSDDEAYYFKKQRKNLELSRKNVYHAIYLDNTTISQLKEKLAILLGVDISLLGEVYTIEKDGIYVLVTDQVVHSIKDKSTFALDTNESDEGSYFRVFMRLLEED
ncbi:DgyrCDS7491 [Dimorphilus gyrociliatus]|nr:DgyrCDS7491 [Dimorphilus gyrociliatus]